MAFQRPIGWLTAPRVALLAFLAVFAMFILVFHAELPLSAALNRVVVLQEAGGNAKLPPNCQEIDLHGYSLGQPLHSFDGLRRGYDSPEAKRILCAMGAGDGTGAEIYLRRHFPLDMAFAGFAGIALAAIWLFLMREFRWSASALTYLALVPIAAALLDWTENLLVHSLVADGPPGSETLIPIASVITQVKWRAYEVSSVVVLGLLFVYLVRRAFLADRQPG